jgi:hypothetical protein
MSEGRVIRAFGTYLVQTPIALVFLALELVGAWTVLNWVVDDNSEAIVAGLFFALVLLSQYLLFRKLWRETQALPAIKFDQSRIAQIHSHSKIAGKPIPRYVPVQVWFENTPGFPTESSIAKQVTARLTIENDSGFRLQFYGQWADSNAPDNLGFNGILDSVDIPPGHLRAKLLVALKYPADDDAFAFTREGLRSSGDGRAARFTIPRGDYSVNIELRGVGVAETFRFTLANPGPGNDLQLFPQRAQN